MIRCNEWRLEVSKDIYIKTQMHKNIKFMSELGFEVTTQPSFLGEEPSVIIKVKKRIAKEE